MEDKVERRIELQTPIAKVWRALSDSHEFGKWFRVKADGPFVPGQVIQGHITYPGYEHLEWKVTVQKMEPEKLFSFTWHPYAVDPKQDYSKETPTLVEFKLESISGGTRLTITESGFDKIPANRRAEAFRMNSEGWSSQLENIETYLMSRKELAVSFLKMVADRKVKEAYERFVAADFIHHNQYFKGDRNSLMLAMEEAGVRNPNKILEVKQVFEDGDTVITFSRVRQHPDDVGSAVVHIFKFRDGEVIELWDVGQAINKDSPNEYGIF